MVGFAHYDRYYMLHSTNIVVIGNLALRKMTVQSEKYLYSDIRSK